MVKFIRRFQQPFMVGFAILSVITLGSFYGHTDFLDKTSGGHVAQIYGRNVTAAQAQRAVRKGELAQQLGMRDYYVALADMASKTRGDAERNFIWNSMVLKHECGILGLEPTEDEVFEAIKAIQYFQNNGVYDPTRYALMSQLLLTPRGFTTEDLGDLVSDDLRLKKLEALLGSTTTPSDSEIRESFTELNQKTEASVVRFKLADFLAAAQVPDEDVKKSYEELKASLNTDELRKVKVAAFVLPPPAKPTDKPLAGKDRADALTKLQKQAEDFAVAMTDKSAKFDQAAAKVGVKVQETPDFPATGAPDAFGGAREVVTAAFKLKQPDPNSDVIETHSGYYVLQLESITPPRPLTFDEAKAKLVETLKSDRAQEALSLKATEVRNKIEEGVKAGKDFAAAAEALGVKAENFPVFSMKEHKADSPDAEEIMQLAAGLKEGQISNATPTADGSVIVDVTRRLPIDEKQLEKDKGEIADYLRGLQRTALFHEWIKLRRAAAQLKDDLHI